MRQHAIPQNILDIEFKLFSKFTIREFVYIAVGVGLGSIFLFLFSAGRMPGILAVPIFAVFTAIGLFFGLVNINDQKADVYVKNFFVAITSPTQRVWKNKNFDEKFEELKPVPGPSVTQGTMDRTIPLAASPEVVTVNPVKAQTEGFEESIEAEEEARLKALSDSIRTQTESIKATIDAQRTVSAPPQANVVQQQAVAVQQTTSEQILPIQPSVPNMSHTQPLQPVVQPTVATPIQPVSPIHIASKNPRVIKLVIGSHNFSPLKTEIQNIQKSPNNINIFLCDKMGTGIEKALVFVKDKEGKLIQAIMSDQAGNIITGKSYPNGNYFVTIQKESYHFPELEFILDGTIIEPIKIIPII
jgi:hypothetical protein